MALFQPVGAGVQVAINARAQTAFGTPLVNAEQIGIAAVDGLSPQPSSRLQGDMGYVVRGEIARPVALRGLRFSIAPDLFGSERKSVVWGRAEKTGSISGFAGTLQK